MGFLSNMISATVKTALSPIAIAVDATKVVTGNEPDTTKNLLESASDDFVEGFDKLGDGDVL